MGKRILTLKQSLLENMLLYEASKCGVDLPSDLEVLMVTTRMECPSAIRILLASKEWPTTEEGETLPKMELP